MSVFLTVARVGAGGVGGCLICVIELRILRVGDHSGLSDWCSVSQVPCKKEAGGSEGKRELIGHRSRAYSEEAMEEEDGRQRNQMAIRSCRSKQMASPRTCRRNTASQTP